MAETDQKKSEEDSFNETLKRMLKTPPKPHEKPTMDKPANPAKPGKERSKSAKKG